MKIKWIDKVTGQEISGPEESTQAKQSAQAEAVSSPSEDTKEDSQTEED